MEAWKGEYSADGGALKVYGPDFSVDFLNGVGDGTFTVEVVDGDIRDRRWEFIGSFEIKSANCVSVSGYDCDESPVYTLPLGGYAVSRDEEGNMLLSRWHKGD